MGNFFSNLGSSISNWWNGSQLGQNVDSNAAQIGSLVGKLNGIAAPSVANPNSAGPGVNSNYGSSTPNGAWGPSVTLASGVSANPVVPAAAQHTQIATANPGATTVTSSPAGTTITHPVAQAVTPVAPAPTYTTPSGLQVNANGQVVGGASTYTGINPATGGSNASGIQTPSVPSQPGTVTSPQGVPEIMANTNAAPGVVGQPYDPNAPTGFSVAPSTEGTVDSSEISGAPTYSDLQSTVGAAQQSYAQTLNAYNSKIASDQAAELKAQYGAPGGDATATSQNMYLLKASDAASEALQGAGVQGAQAQVGFAQQNLQNFFTSQSNQRANAPTFDNFQTNPNTGDVFATTRDPQSGQTSLVNLGNIYDGTFNQANPTIGGSLANSANISMSGPNGSSGTGMVGAPINQTGQALKATLPGPIQPAFYQTQGGYSYINSDLIPSNLQNMAQNVSAQTGIPILTADQVSKAQNIDVTQQNLDQIESVIPQILGSGLAGRLKGLTENQIEQAAQTNPTIASFGVYRDTAINAIQSLAGGSGSGFRLNQAEINTATDNLPTISDNLETAQSKLQILNGFISKWTAELFPGQNGASQQNQSTASPADVVQTSVGAINTNW